MVDLTSKQTGDCSINGLEPNGAPDVFLKLLAAQSDLREIVHDQDWVVFENQEFIPHFAFFDQAVFAASLTDSPSALETGADGVTRMVVFGDSPALATSTRSEMAGLAESMPPIGAAREDSASSISFRAIRIGEVKYDIAITTTRPVYILFGESYDPQWNAYYSDGGRLVHFPAFYYANGYYVARSGNFHVSLSFDSQPMRNLEIFFSGMAWAAVAGTLLFLTIKVRKKHNPGNTPK